MSGWPMTGKPQGRVVAPNKLWHAFKHKNWDVLRLDVDAEEDHNYVAASERFLALQTQAPCLPLLDLRGRVSEVPSMMTRKAISGQLDSKLGMVLHHTCTFQKSLEEALQQAVELADDFGRISSGQGAGNMSEPWAVTAGGQAFYLKAMLEESVVSLRQHLHNDLEEGVLRSLREEVSAFSAVPTQMTERANLKVEMLHYSKKLEELRVGKSNQRNNDEKMDRNKEKYAQASQALRDQTSQLMSTFAHAEQLRQRLLIQDLPKVIVSEKEAFDAFAVNLNKAATRDPDDPNIPFGIPPPLTSNPGRLPGAGPNPNPMPSVPISEVPLTESAPPPREASSVAKMEPPPPYSETQAIGKKQSPRPVSPKGSGSVSPSKRSTNGEMADPDSKATHFLGPPTTDSASCSADDDEDRLDEKGDSGMVSKSKGNGNIKSRDRKEEHDGIPPPAPDTVDTVDTVDARESDPPPHAVEVSDEEIEESPDDNDADDDDDDGDADDGGVETLPPDKVRVRALYDYEATQDGDLSFREGDVIMADSSAVSGEGWVTGACDGNEGIFPANYTEPC